MFLEEREVRSGRLLRDWEEELGGEHHKYARGGAGNHQHHPQGCIRRESPVITVQPTYVAAMLVLFCSALLCSDLLCLALLYSALLC